MNMEVPPIIKLDEDVINRIAAGEVVQRPANALKELIENSLDAEATNIQITIKDGGMKLLQIQDNGTGIRKEDFEIVCERFTTSKLKEFEDLHKISTYGFRGEALASISHIAHLTIISKTKKDICAYHFRAHFIDSKLQGNPKPTAGNQGTIITVEDLFYNMMVRKRSLRSPAEEYQKISEVVSKYAIHNARVGFALKKSGESNDIRTPQNSSHIDNIRTIYGNAIARELIDFSLENEPFKFKVKGYITNVNYSTKKFQFLLFINHRLVDCQSLKKCIDRVYTTYLPKNTHPFVYLSLELEPSNIDVNVHPTKHEVHFLNEEQIVECITSALETKLLGSNNSRSFFTQAKLPKSLQIEPIEFKRDESDTSTKQIKPNSIVRTDAREQKLEKFFGEPSSKKVEDIKEKNPNESLTEEEYQKHNESFLKRTENLESKILNKTEDIFTDPEIEYIEQKKEQIEEIQEKSKDKCSTKQQTTNKPLTTDFIKKITRVETKLTSVLQLRKEIEDTCHRALRESFSQHVFVGAINPSQALIQYSTKLFLCNTKTILMELFYQFIMYNFQNFDTYIFSNKISLYELSLICLELPEAGWTPEDGDKSELAKRITTVLSDKAPMLLDYFSINIDESGNICSIPILLDEYMPDPKALPMYIVRLATEVNWDSEKECFQTFARETAQFYAEVSEEPNQTGKDWRWVTEHVLYPAIKEYFIPPKSFIENAAILEVTSLPNLYKVFERC
ncbi:DNA mismatch repair ATPase Mlh1 isoform X1 [Leptinotarsa decemlineata]|uniref:DNA mismatch repair ATPase Mlh1 isoform X1 n=1 Tax=Leptinotarsa decemlineata TaxID=7539 RepID=UPI003D30D76F